jgi:hypothetical protein
MSKTKTKAPLKKAGVSPLYSSDFELRQPRILIVDIETAPHLGYVWGYFDQNVLAFKERGYLLSIGWKWLGEKKVHVRSLRHFDGYTGGRSTARELTKQLWDLFDEADIVVAHNGKSFDVKMAYQWFIEYKLGPTSFFHQVDTKIEAKKIGRFPSNKLDQLGDQLGLGRKMTHQGMELWFGCMEGKSKEWSVMERYNVQDVKLEEELYLELLPYMKSHPNVNVIMNRDMGCSKCGAPGSELVNRGSRAYVWTNMSKAPRYQCKKCNGYTQGMYKKISSYRSS